MRRPAERLARAAPGRLREAGIAVLDPSELTDGEIDWLEDRFLDEIFPMLTPLAIDPAHPFPFIPNLRLRLALQALQSPADSQSLLTALVPLPPQLERFVRLPGTDDPLSCRWSSLS